MNDSDLGDAVSVGYLEGYTGPNQIISFYRMDSSSAISAHVDYTVGQVTISVGSKISYVFYVAIHNNDQVDGATLYDEIKANYGSYMQLDSNDENTDSSTTTTSSDSSTSTTSSDSSTTTSSSDSSTTTNSTENFTNSTNSTSSSSNTETNINDLQENPLLINGPKIRLLLIFIFLGITNIVISTSRNIKKRE